MASAQRVSNFEGELADLATLLKNKYLLTIRRDKVFEDFVEFLRKPEGEISRFEVKFTIDGWTEPATDTGGPRNQLFTLFYQECMAPERRMFQYNEKELFPIDNKAALKGRWFFCLGRAIVLSLVQQGAGFPYLARCCFEKIVYNQHTKEHQIITKLHQKLAKAQNEAKTDEELLQMLGDSEIKMLLAEMKLTGRETKQSETQVLLKNFIRLHQGKEALAQLVEGLQSLRFLDKVRKFDSDLKRFLVPMDAYLVDSVFMRMHLLDSLVELKAKSEAQINVKGWAASCLTILTDEEALNLYEFITGMRSLPPGECDIMVDFNVQNTSDKLPRAITCAWLLLLPLGNESDKEFIRSFKTALNNRTEFGRI
ncbi:uncharacterized protein LOC132548445 [Ylistrum balloti]|uniref:uncharacterized protein LOC132548445 n=1 Tax=Ylistrum balloti TaxID=509963 RepID=UPI0029057E4D|nr:uncharacterized protein LOC132548445 [Ylistrum balloti]